MCWLNENRYKLVNDDRVKILILQFDPQKHADGMSGNYLTNSSDCPKYLLNGHFQMRKKEILSKFLVIMELCILPPYLKMQVEILSNS